MELRYHPYDLRLKHEFRISREAHVVQPTLVVELVQNGQHGYGEATSNPYYGVTVESMMATLDRVRPLLAEASWDTPADVWNLLSGPLANDPFPLCAVDLACHDLWGKLRGQPVYQLWGLDPSRNPSSNYTIGIDSVEVMVAKLKEMPDWPIYKIKLGTPDDIRIVQELRRHTDATFRVDANCGWTLENALQRAPILRDLGVEFIEQPLPADRVSDYEELYRKCPLPIIADESCIHEHDVAGCHHRFHGINIKLVKCGGMTPARRMIDQARTLDMRVMVGCMTESTVGISAIAQLLPLLDYVDMDGAALLAEDIAEGVRVERGKCIYPDRPGHGVRLL
jgi:L-alanine-DL-glutamate epimerase-like enolase superfamily enzyme